MNEAKFYYLEKGLKVERSNSPRVKKHFCKIEADCHTRLRLLRMIAIEERRKGERVKRRKGEEAK
jgi:tRNA A58 N-methylase Trm61